MEPGWYPDQYDPASRRYWDGTRWSEAVPNTAEQPEPAPPTDRRPRTVRFYVEVGVIVAAVAGFLIYWFAVRTTTMTVRGTMDIEGRDNFSVSAPDAVGNQTCAGSGGYSDLAEGAGVTVTDGSGNTIATGHLEAGIFIRGTDACIFGFQVTVPDDKDFYGIEVTHRGTVEFSKADMKDGPGLTIGDH